MKLRTTRAVAGGVLAVGIVVGTVAVAQGMAAQTPPVHQAPADDGSTSLTGVQAVEPGVTLSAKPETATATDAATTEQQGSAEATSQPATDSSVLAATEPRTPASDPTSGQQVSAPQSGDTASPAAPPTDPSALNPPVPDPPPGQDELQLQPPSTPTPSN